jgi:hypothetical protein
MKMRDVQVSASGIMVKDCTKVRKANVSLRVVVIVDVSSDIDESPIVNIKIASILKHCGMTV